MWRSALIVGLILPVVARAQGAPAAPPATARAEQAPDRAAEERERVLLDGVIDALDYRLGPGDRLALELWGLRDVRTEVEVGAEGSVAIPRVGVFPARGQTLAALRAAVEKRVRAVYPSLQGTITLLAPRRFRVHVVGAVAHPGSYPATPLTRVSELVTQAGGPLPRGSLRAVEVRRQGPGEQKIAADLLRFTVLGQRDGDPTVLDGDTLFVPLREVEVELTGAVKRPGRYELTGGRDVRELLELGGGPSADLAASLPIRVSSRGEGDRVVARSVPQKEAAGLQLRDGDQVHVPSLADLRRTVVVEGAVVGLEPAAVEWQRAPYLVNLRADATVSGPREVSIAVAFVEGDGIRDLINKVGGLQPWADSQNAFLLRNEEKKGRQRILVDVTAITAGRSPEVSIRAGDTLVIPSRRESVMVSGAVQRPGLYQFSRELKPADYITLAGGTTRLGDSRDARVLTRNGESKRLGKVSVIEPGDSIAVPERRVTAAEWIEMALILGNLAVASTALALSQVRF